MKCNNSILNKMSFHQQFLLIKILCIEIAGVWRGPLSQSMKRKKSLLTLCCSCTFCILQHSSKQDPHQLSLACLSRIYDTALESRWVGKIYNFLKRSSLAEQIIIITSYLDLPNTYRVIVMMDPTMGDETKKKEENQTFEPVQGEEQNQPLEVLKKFKFNYFSLSRILTLYRSSQI